MDSYSEFRFSPMGAERGRDVSDIYPGEITHAALAVVGEHGSMSSKALFEELKAIFGFKRLTERLEVSFEEILQQMVRRKKIRWENERYTLNG